MPSPFQRWAHMIFISSLDQGADRRCLLLQVSCFTILDKHDENIYGDQVKEFPVCQAPFPVAESGLLGIFLNSIVPCAIEIQLDLLSRFMRVTRDFVSVDT